MTDEMGLFNTGVEYGMPVTGQPYKEDAYGHHWTLIINYTLSRTEVLESMRGEKVHLDAESIAGTTPIVCMKCELAFTFAAHHDCPGEPRGYDAKGRPLHHPRWVREAFKEMDEENKNAGS